MDFKYEKNRIYLDGEDGKTIAEVTFPDLSKDVVNINHTFVDESLRGQGVAGKLLLAAAEKLRGEGKKAYLSCSYAIKWFESHPDYSDLKTDRSL